MNAAAPTHTYGPRTVKRARRTADEIAAVDMMILDAVAEDAPVSLRGVFYRVMSKGGVPKTDAGYRAIVRRLLRLRRTGIVSFWDIADGTRWVVRPTRYDGVDESLTATAKLYRRSLWTHSPFALALFSEKDAITGILEPVSDHWDVPLSVLRGDSSETFAYKTAKTLDPSRLNVLAQLGDHAPSGVSAWDTFCRKVTTYADPGARMTFQRLAVTPAQIEAWALPTRPAKEKDRRAKGWEGGCVEVDAIPARRLRTIVTNWVERFVDVEQLSVLQAAEESEREILTILSWRRA